MLQDLAADIELLVDDGCNAVLVRRVDDGAHLGAENALGDGPLKQRVEIRHRLHDLHAVLFIRQALVDLQERHDAAGFPEILRGRHTIDIAVHGTLEQDRSHDLVAIKGRRLDDPRAHLVDQAEHLLIIRIGVFLDAIEAKRLRRRTARLVERGNKAVFFRCLLCHFFVLHGSVSCCPGS